MSPVVQERLSPEEWEAADHIENLKASIPKPGEKLHGVCIYHSAQSAALIWIIRHMDTESRSVGIPAGVSATVTAIIIGLIEAAKFCWSTTP